MKVATAVMKHQSHLGKEMVKEKGKSKGLRQGPSKPILLSLKCLKALLLQTIAVL